MKKCNDYDLKDIKRHNKSNPKIAQQEKHKNNHIEIFIIKINSKY